MIFDYLPDKAPPKSSVGILCWLKRNLFSNLLNTLLTISALLFLAFILPPIINWGLIHATFTGDNASMCNTDGACWAFIINRFQQFMYGFYPKEYYWRVNIVFLLYLPLTLLSIILIRNKAKTISILLALFIFPLVSWLLLHGGYGLLPVVPTRQWGGMMLTLTVAVYGILFSLPLGILIALGKHSSLKIVRYFCIIFIELWRSLPLITILFMASIFLPMILPNQLAGDSLTRAIIGVIMFASAYMAEVIRSGLDAIPKGQYEAADSLGLNYITKMRLIILPQALRQVIPGITNTYIGLFKETTLVSIIGIYDFLGIVHSASQDPNWLGKSFEGYIFCAIVYFTICYGLTRLSYYFEHHYHPERH